MTSEVQRNNSKPSELLRKGPAHLSAKTHGSPGTARGRPCAWTVCHNQPSPANQVSIPSDCQGLSSRTVLRGADHMLSLGLRHWRTGMHILSLRQDPLPGLPDTWPSITCSGLCGLFLASHSIPQEWEPKETAKSTFTWPESKSSANSISTATLRWNRQSPKKAPQRSK